MSAVAQRLAAVQARVDQALARAGRAPGAARIVAVTKRHPAETVRLARAAGITDVGENYAQEMVAKQEAMVQADQVGEADQADQAGEVGEADALTPGAAGGGAAGLRWHFIGTLQRNKAKLVVGRAALIHAVDSLALARTIDRLAETQGRVQPVLVAVNVGGEAHKSGVDPAEARALLAALAELAHVACVGLMTMPPLARTPEDNRACFRRLRALRDDLRTPAQPLAELSMGTTGDFEVAVEEGATLVRVGTALFGPRPA